MITVHLNNQPILILPNSTLADTLNKYNDANVHCAIAINRHFIPRSKYADTLLNDGDVIDIITPMQGG